MSESSMITPIGTLSFPHLFTPKAPSPNARERFSCVLVFTPEDQQAPEFAALKANLGKAAREQWGEKVPANLRNPVRQCSEKDHFEKFPAGSVFVNFWSYDKPAVVNGNLQNVTVPGDVYAGQRARVSYRPFAYDNSGNRGVSIYLNNVQLTDMTAERIDGRRAADKEFDKVAQAASAAFDDGDDANPFA